MDAVLLCCAAVALASHGSVVSSSGHEPTTEAWLGSGVPNDTVDMLYLPYRSIQRVPRAAFRNTHNARYISVNNNISDIDVGAFEGVPWLRYLYLDNNDISSLPEEVFRPVPGLVVLYLSFNRIAELSPSHFAGLTSLWTLWIDNNRVELQLHNRTFANLPQLREIHLSSSNIQVLPRDLFAGSTALFLIHLSDNKIEELDASIFYGLANLQELRLSRNRLHTLGPAVFAQLPSLLGLDLSHNNIHYLSEEDMHFRGRPTVDLRYNEIEYFDPYTYDNNQEVPTFLLNNNPYHCSCSFLPFVLKCLNQDVKLTLKIDEASCAEPAGLKGTRLSQLSEDSLGNCNTTPSTSPATPTDSVTATPEVLTLATEYPVTPISTPTAPHPEGTSVTEPTEHFSTTTSPIISSTSPPSPVTSTSTLRDILSLIAVLPAASPGSHRNGRNNIYISGPIIFFNIFNSSVSPSSL